MKYKSNGVKITVVLLSVLILALGVAALASADTTSVIDFEGLAEGMIVGSVASGSGISGYDAIGSVLVYGHNPALPGNNLAMIFDATCGGGPPSSCTGTDNDLWQPALGNVLIISEDGDGTNPDDADVVGARFDFDYSGWGPAGLVTVNSINVLDVDEDENGGVVRLYAGGAGGTLLSTVSIPVASSGELQNLPIGVSGVDFMQVFLNGSAAIDNVSIEVEPPGDAGCTPGYWKNHLDSWPTAYSTEDDFDTVFGVDLFDPDITLGEAVNAKGGGVKKLARHGTAALLSAAHPDVDYPLSVAQVIAAVQAGDADTLVGFNELGCPID